MELLGISEIKDLPYGSGKPPADDVQLFTGCASFDCNILQWDKSAQVAGSKPKNPPTSPIAEIPLYSIAMVWHGDIIEHSKISSDYAEWNAAHPCCIRQNRESFVIYTSDDDPGVAIHACDFQVAIRHNRRLHDPDLDIAYNPGGYIRLAEHMNALDAPRWAIYHPNDDTTIWPAEGDLPTLAEFMVRDADIYDPAIPNGKVLVDVDFQKRAIELMLNNDQRRQRAIEFTRAKRAIKRSGEVEGKLSADERAKLALKQARVRADYVARAGAKAKANAQDAAPVNNGEGSSSNNEDDSMGQ